MHIGTVCGIPQLGNQEARQLLFCTLYRIVPKRSILLAQPLKRGRGGGAQLYSAIPSTNIDPRRPTKYFFAGCLEFKQCGISCQDALTGFLLRNLI